MSKLIEQKKELEDMFNIIDRYEEAVNLNHGWERTKIKTGDLLRMKFKKALLEVQKDTARKIYEACEDWIDIPVEKGDKSMKGIVHPLDIYKQITGEDYE